MNADAAALGKALRPGDEAALQRIVVDYLSVLDDGGECMHCQALRPGGCLRTDAPGVATLCRFQEARASHA
jgi:hypothetical protein